MNRKRKVIFVGKYKTAGNIYSIQNVSFEVFNLHSAKEDSDFICYFDDGNIFSKYQKLFGKRIELTTTKGKIIRLGIFKFILYLFKNRNSIIHIISFEKLGTISVIFKKIFNLKTIYTIHGLEEYEGGYFIPKKFSHRVKFQVSQYILHKYSDIILTQSKLYKNLINKILNIELKKIKVIPNGISNYFNKSSIENKINGIIKLLYIANPRRSNKGFEFLINIIKELNVKYELKVVCDKNEVIKENDGLNICYVENMPQDKLSELIEEINFILVTSKSESFSMPAIESMSLGKVCVITNTSGASEYIINVKNGYVVDYLDTKRVIGIVKELFYNPELVKSISSEARKIYDTLNWENIYNNYYSKLYTEM